MGRKECLLAVVLFLASSVASEEEWDGVSWWNEDESGVETNEIIDKPVYGVVAKCVDLCTANLADERSPMLLSDESCPTGCAVMDKYFNQEKKKSPSTHFLGIVEKAMDMCKLDCSVGEEMDHAKCKLGCALYQEEIKKSQQEAKAAGKQEQVPSNKDSDNSKVEVKANSEDSDNNSAEETDNKPLENGKERVKQKSASSSSSEENSSSEEQSNHRLEKVNPKKQVALNPQVAKGDTAPEKQMAKGDTAPEKQMANGDSAPEKQVAKGDSAPEKQMVQQVNSDNDLVREVNSLAEKGRGSEKENLVVPDLTNDIIELGNPNVQEPAIISLSLDVGGEDEMDDNNSGQMVVVGGMQGPQTMQDLWNILNLFLVDLDRQYQYIDTRGYKDESQQMNLPLYYKTISDSGATSEAYTGENVVDSVMEKAQNSLDYLKDSFQSAMRGRSNTDNLLLAIMGVCIITLVYNLLESLLCPPKYDIKATDDYYRLKEEPYNPALPTYEDCIKNDKYLLASLHESGEIQKVNLDLPVIVTEGEKKPNTEDKA